MKHVLILTAVGLLLLMTSCRKAEAPPKLDLSTPEAPVIAFVAALEKGDVEAATPLLSTRVRERFGTPDKVKAFMDGWKAEGKFIKVLAAQPAQEINGVVQTRVNVLFERKGKQDEARIKVVREEGQWRWDET